MHDHFSRIVCTLHLLFGAAGAQADELVCEKSYASNDGKKLIETRLWLEPDWAGPRIDIVVKEYGKVRYRRIIPPTSEARYVKVSWAPTSDAALVAVNYKASEDWILIRLPKDRTHSDYFDGDKLVKAAMLERLPFREDIKSSAPLGRVAWKTVRWHDSKQCTMRFIFHGYGYEGTTRLAIDFKRVEALLEIRSITPRVDEKLWVQD